MELNLCKQIAQKLANDENKTFYIKACDRNMDSFDIFCQELYYLYEEKILYTILPEHRDPAPV